MVYLPKIIPRVPSNLSLRGFMKSDFKYSALELSGATSPTDGRGCSQRLRWKTMSMRMRILSVSLLVGICVAIQVTIILLIRGHYRRPAPVIDLPESVKYPWRSFPEYVTCSILLIIGKIGDPSYRIAMKLSLASHMPTSNYHILVQDQTARNSLTKNTIHIRQPPIPSPNSVRTSY